MRREPTAWLLMAALPQEVRPFLRLVTARRRRDLPFPAWEFRAGGREGLAALTGMGAGAASELWNRLVERFSPRMIISAGFAGALGPELRVGDLVLAAAFYRCQPENCRLLQVAPPPSLPSLETVRGALQAAGLRAHLGSFLTPEGVIPKARVGAAAAHLAHPVLELESSVLAALAAAQGLPFLALRAITDPVGVEIPPFIAEAVRRSRPPGLRDAVGWLRQDLRRLRVLFHFWRASHLAGRRLARGLQVVVEAMCS